MQRGRDRTLREDGPRYRYQHLMFERHKFESYNIVLYVCDTEANDRTPVISSVVLYHVRERDVVAIDAKNRHNGAGFSCSHGITARLHDDSDVIDDTTTSSRELKDPRWYDGRYFPKEGL